MRVRWLAMFQALFLLSAIGVAIPALIDWRVWNGVDLLAILLALAFIATCFIEEDKRPQ